MASVFSTSHTHDSPPSSCRSSKTGSGVTRIANLSGREVSHLARAVLFCLPGLFDGVLRPDTDAEVRCDCLALEAALIEFYSALLSWTSYCFLKVHTESSLKGLQQAFLCVLDLLPKTFPHREGKFDIWKFHVAQHIALKIRLGGALPFHSTGDFERAHIEFMKDPARGSNRREVWLYIIRSLELTAAMANVPSASRLAALDDAQVEEALIDADNMFAANRVVPAHVEDLDNGEEEVSADDAAPVTSLARTGGKRFRLKGLQREEFKTSTSYRNQPLLKRLRLCVANFCAKLGDEYDNSVTSFDDDDIWMFNCVRIVGDSFRMRGRHIARCGGKIFGKRRYDCVRLKDGAYCRLLCLFRATVSGKPVDCAFVLHYDVSCTADEDPLCCDRVKICRPDGHPDSKPSVSIICVDSIDHLVQLVPRFVQTTPVEEGCLHHSDGSPLFYPWTSAATRDRFAGKTPACPLKKVSTARQRSKVPSRKSTAATSSGNRGREGMPGPTNAGGQYMYARRTHGGLIELDPRPEITEWYINRWLHCL